MKSTALTPTQNAVLHFVVNFGREHQTPPTRLEIAKHFGWRSSNNAEEHLQALARKGRVRLVAGRSRGIFVLEHCAPEFQEFPKMARWSRDVVITEKIDGTNAAVLIVNHGPDDTIEQHCVAAVGDFRIYAQSRSRFITPADDNFGFAAWVRANADELLGLGEGRHFGEWWGAGIQRRYGLTEKRFSLFNVARWSHDDARPSCCYAVPALYVGPNEPGVMEDSIQRLRRDGSYAAPGFMDPEGVVLFHTAGNVGFKKTIKRDEVPKALAGKADALACEGA